MFTKGTIGRMLDKGVGPLDLLCYLIHFHFDYSIRWLTAIRSYDYDMKLVLGHGLWFWLFVCHVLVDVRSLMLEDCKDILRFFVESRGFFLLSDG